ncbi:unnamed protein product, partial [Didymodactylos carnosus]
MDLGYVHLLSVQDSDLQIVNDTLMLNRMKNITLIWLDENIDGEIKQLLEQLNDDVLGCTNRDIFFEAINKIKNDYIILILSELTKESAEFLWYQLIRDYLINIPKTVNSQQEMIDKCRSYYRGNQSYLKYVNEFQETYKTNQNGIKWYTKTSFIYRLVNQALRTEDIEALLTLRYYIVDLCTWLKQESDELKEYLCRITITLYRGLKLSDDEIEKLKNNIDNLISTNGFLSTSKSIEIACAFATNVLFEIKVNTEVENIIFAHISEYSMIKGEGEVLFDLGTTFRITNVEYNDNIKLWIVSMIDDVDEGFNIIKDYIKMKKQKMNEIMTGKISFSSGWLLIEMGQYTKAIYYFENLLQYTTNEIENICISTYL